MDYNEIDLNQVNIEDYPCHIASMPLAINIGCHVNRHKSVRL